MTEPRRLDVVARRNTPWLHTFNVTGASGLTMDLTGHTASLQVRLYGMQPGDPLIDLATVATELSEGLLIAGADVTAFIETVPLQLLPTANTASRDVRFYYDLILTDPDGYSWVERWGAFDLTEGVTADPQTFLLTDAGAALMTAAGEYLEAA